MNYVAVVKISDSESVICMPCLIFIFVFVLQDAVPLMSLSAPVAIVSQMMMTLTGIR